MNYNFYQSPWQPLSAPCHVTASVISCGNTLALRHTTRRLLSLYVPSDNASAAPFVSLRPQHVRYRQTRLAYRFIQFLLFTSRVGFVVRVKAARFLSNGDSCDFCPRRWRPEPRIRCRACPRSAFRCRPALQQPVVHRRGRVRHGLVSCMLHLISVELFLRVLQCYTVFIFTLGFVHSTGSYVAFSSKWIRELFTHFLEHFSQVDSLLFGRYSRLPSTGHRRCVI